MATSDSLWALRADLLSAKLLAWIATVGRDADLSDEAHFYFADRYWRLAKQQSRRGREARASVLRDKADAHYQAAGGDDDGPPYAAAMAMPRPRQWTLTDARSDRRFRPPDDAA
jgi:hypothetical protein